MPLFEVGEAATCPSEVREDTSAKPITAHRQLLLTAVTHQLGPLAGAICRALILCGPLTLKDISEAVGRDEEMRAVAAAAANRASATGETMSAVPATHQVGASFHVDVANMSSVDGVIHDVAIKEHVTRMVVHRLVHADPTTHLYQVRHGSAILLRVLFPLLLHCARQQYGEAAKCVLLAVYQLGVVPPLTAVQVVLSRTPSITRDAVEYAVVRLVEDHWLVPATADANVGGTSAGSASLWSASAPYRVGLRAALHFLYNDALEQAVAERYADGRLALSLVRALRRRASPSSAYAEACASWQELAAEVPAGAAGLRRDRSGEVRHDGVPGGGGSAAEAVQRCLERLCQPVVLLSCPAASSVTATVGVTPGQPTMPATRSLLTQPPGHRGFYAVDATAATHLMQESVCERVVYSRYGVLGVRIMKLLLQHHYLEERTLAEQSIATHVKTREVLHHMFRDGVLLQQEMPRTSPMGDRAAKASAYLWGLSWEATLLPAVREFIAHSLTVAWVRLRESQQQLAAATSCSVPFRSSSSTSSPLALGGGAAGGAAAAQAEAAETLWKRGLAHNVQQVTQAQRTVTGLQSCVMSLMRLLLVVDFF